MKKYLFLFVVAATMLGMLLTPRLAGAQLPGGTLDPTLIPKYVTPLVIPPEMPQTSANYYEIAVRQFQQQILPAPLPMTTVWSYGSLADQGTVAEGGSFNYPAFTIEAQYGVPTQVKWINDLVDASGDYLPHLLPVDQTLHWANPPGGETGRDMMGMDPTTYTGPVPIITHVHGAHTTEDSDGYPEAWYLPAANDIPAGYATVGSLYDIFAAKAAADGRVWETGSALFQYPNDQRATTLWYHDHSLGMTRVNVYAGPAGFYLIRGGADDLDMGFNRPGLTLGVGVDPAQPITEIPIVIQDRSFDADGSLFYPDNRAFFEGLTTDNLQIPFIPDFAVSGEPSDVSPIWNPEFFGNTMVVNGNTWPYLDVEQRQYRFRLLNGSQSRFLILKLDNGGTFYQIGTEGGFLPTVVPLTELLIAPAERADVIIDFSAIPVGTSIIMQNIGPDEPFGGGVPGVDFAVADPGTTGQVMEFRVVALSGSDSSTPVADLVLPPLTPVGTPDVTLPVSLNEMMSMTVWVTIDPVTGVITEVPAGTPGAEMFGPTMALLGTLDSMTNLPTALHWSAPITEIPMLGETGVFEIHNFTMDAHPIHIHLVQFQVVNRETVDPGTGLPTGITRPPEVWEVGYKDTVIAYPGEITRVKAHFDIAGLFVWHCHILEHEDNEMMRPYMTYAVPTVYAGADATINEGATFTGSGSFSAPGAGPWTATVDYGDGSGVQPLTLSGIGFDLSHVYVDNGAYTVTVVVTDAYGGQGRDTAVVTVNNVAPTVNAGADQSAYSGVSVSVNATFTDPGTMDTHTATIDWGDGTTEAGVVVEASGSGTVTGSHVYLNFLGDATVLVTVTDNDGGAGSDSLVVTVTRYPVTLDIKPDGTNANPINISTPGIVPVAVLSTAAFDATQIDPITVLFANAAPIRWTIEDVNLDGLMDILFQFNIQETNITKGQTQATLTGVTYGGQFITGTDSIKVITKGKK